MLTNVVWASTYIDCVCMAAMVERIDDIALDEPTIIGFVGHPEYVFGPYILFVLVLM